MTAPLTAEVRVRSQRPLGYVIAILMLVAIVSSFESTMMYTALPTLIKDFNSSESAVSWVLTGFLLVGAASAAISGRLGDIFGRKRVLVILLIASIVGSLISLFSGDIGGVILGRAVQGLAGGLLPLAFGIIRESVAPKHLSVSVSLVAGTAMLAGAAGNIVAGNIVDTLGWRYIFVVAASLTVVTVIGALFLKGTRPSGPRDRIDWVGGIAFAPGLALVLFGINAASGLGWFSPIVLGVVGIGLVILVLWGVWEARHKAPMVNVRLFAKRNLGLTLLIAASARHSPGHLGLRRTAHHAVPDKRTCRIRPRGRSRRRRFVLHRPLRLRADTHQRADRPQRQSSRSPSSSVQAPASIAAILTILGAVTGTHSLRSSSARWYSRSRLRSCCRRCRCWSWKALRRRTRVRQPVCTPSSRPPSPGSARRSESRFSPRLLRPGHRSAPSLGTSCCSRAVAVLTTIALVVALFLRKPKGITEASGHVVEVSRSAA